MAWESSVNNGGRPVNRERIDLGAMRPGGAAQPLEPGQQRLMDNAPEMSSRFWGSVSFSYQGGRLVNIQVTESIKADG